MNRIGLYQENTGEIVLVSSFSTLSFSNGDLPVEVVNFIRLNTPTETHTMLVTDFFEKVPTSTTGQSVRFIRIENKVDGLKSYSDNELIEELTIRSCYSSRAEMYLESLEEKQFSTDYVIGEAFEGDYERGIPKGVYTYNTFDDLDQAQNYMERFCPNKHAEIFKRIFLKVD